MTTTDSGYYPNSTVTYPSDEYFGGDGSITSTVIIA